MAEAVFVVAALSLWLGMAMQPARGRPSPAVRRWRTWRAEEEGRRPVADLVYVALAVGFSFAILGHAIACERQGGPRRWQSAGSRSRMRGGRWP